jgi:hypothetical protein
VEYKETMFEDSHKMLGRRIPVDRVIADPTEEKNEAEPDEWKQDAFVQKLANRITPD